MGELIAKLALLFGVVVVLPTALIFVFSQRSSNYIAAFPDKLALLARTPPPRIIFVGGSNIAFGLDSPLIEESLQIRTMNMGLHVSLGLRLMLESVKPFIRPGDIVIVVPEYPLIWGPMVDGLNDGTLNELLAVDLSAARYITTWGQWRNILAGWPMWFRDKLQSGLSRSLHGVIEWLSAHLPRSKSPSAASASQSGMPWSSGIHDPKMYYRTAFNNRGDDVGRDGPIRGHRELPFSPSVGREVNRNALSVLNTFGRAAVAREATVLFAFPCYRLSFYERESERIRARMNEFVPQLELPVLNRPVDVALRDSLFFDTRYHLNTEGKALRTQIMIRQLRAWIERQQP